MVTTIWLSLPDRWKLTDVQAGVQVIIAVLCTLGTFAFARFCWQLSSLNVAKNKAVKLSSLISINTIGEALDALFLLRRNVFRRRYWRILSQSITVILLSLAAIVSGPIAKASTRIATDVHTLPEPGLLASRRSNSLRYGSVQWNQTATSLDRAGFPYDQLLDFVPNTDLEWVYDPDEWNSSWTMACDRTDYQPVTLVDVGNCTGLYNEVPGINDIFPQDDFTYTYPSWYAYYKNSTFLYDALLVVGGWNYPGYDNVTGVTLNMTFSAIAFHLEHLARAEADTDCLFGKGPIQSSVYNMVQCTLIRDDTLSDAWDTAYPDHPDQNALMDAYISHYTMRMIEEFVQGQPVTGITTDELIRFYQSYLAVKDTFHPQPVTRSISMNVRVVQISLTFVTLASLLLLLDLLGIINYLWFSWKYMDVVAQTPISKLDWAVQSVIEKSDDPKTPVPRSNPRRSVVAAVPGSYAHLDKSEKARTYFEYARFHGYNQEDSIPLNFASGPTPAISASSPPKFSPNISPYDDARYDKHDVNIEIEMQAPTEHNYMPYKSHAGYSPLT